MIPATLDKNTSKPMDGAIKKRVAGYARVSTDNEDQVNSYEAQVDYYTDYIQKRDDWTFVKVYTDDGISGTSTAKRTGFNNMIDDALNGKIDLIVTKSVSRFARNTVDSLSTIRRLKDQGVEVYFEKENIWTFDSSGELLLTIMSSLSQEESRSISLNVTWGVRKGMQDGKVHVAYKNFLGYDRGEDGNLVVNEEQAKVVRRIFSYFIQGLSRSTIAKRMIELDIETAKGAKTWSGSSIDRMLRNEKYKGDALLQKTFTTNYLTKKSKVNEGEVPQYYVEGNHPAIIEPVVFDWVQKEIEIRGSKYSGVHFFSSRIFCEECGGVYVRRIWHSKENYKKIVWQCGCKYSSSMARKQSSQGSGGVGRVEEIIPNPISNISSYISTEEHGTVEIAESGKAGEQEQSEQNMRPWDWICPSPSFHEDDIKKAFLKAVNKLLQGRDEAIAAFELAKSTIFDTSVLEVDLVSVNAEIKGAKMRMKAMNTVKLEPDAYGIDGASDEGGDAGGEADGAGGEAVSTEVGETDEDTLFMDVNAIHSNEAMMAMRMRMDEAKQRQEFLKRTIKNKRRRKVAVDEYVKELRKIDGRVTEFSAELFTSLVDYITVKKIGEYTNELTFRFLDGTDITVNV